MMPHNPFHAIYDILGLPEAPFPGTLPQASESAIPGRLAALQELNRYIAAPEEAEITELPKVGRLEGKEKAALILSVLGDVLRTISTAKKGKAEPFQFTPQALGQLRGKRLGEALRSRSEREGRRIGAAKESTLEREDIIRGIREEDIAERAATRAGEVFGRQQEARTDRLRRIAADEFGVEGVKDMTEDDLYDAIAQASATKAAIKADREARGEKRAERRVGVAEAGLGERRKAGQRAEEAFGMKKEAVTEKKQGQRAKAVADAKKNISSIRGNITEWNPEGVVVKGFGLRTPEQLRADAMLSIQANGITEKGDIEEIMRHLDSEIWSEWERQVVRGEKR